MAVPSRRGESSGSAGGAEQGAGRGPTTQPKETFVRTRRRPSGAVVIAALVLAVATLGQGPPADAQTFPDAHICELSANPPVNSRPGVISVTAVVQCFTDRDSRPRTPGQFESISITIRLFRADLGVPVGDPKELTSGPSTGLTGSLTFPDPRSTAPQLCESGRFFAEVTGSVVFKSGEPRTVRFKNPDGSEILRTGAAFVTCETTSPPFTFPSGPTANGDDMQPGEVLTPDALIRSADGRFRLHYQNDTNLVLYRDHPATVPLWAAGLHPGGLGVTIMQRDGNLVVYNAQGRPVWASGTDGNPGSWLWVQNDGNLVIYRPDGAPIWASNTVQPSDLSTPASSAATASGSVRNSATSNT